MPLKKQVLTQEHNRNAGWKFYIWPVCTTAVGIVVFWLWFPDTRGLALEEIAKLFGVCTPLIPLLSHNR
jgi:ABC-type sugar transport system permease subunit